MFRREADRRGKLADRRIDQLTVNDTTAEASSVVDLFKTMGSDRPAASQMMFNYLAAGGDPQSVVDHARRLVFLKGNDSHDYKFSSAALEDYRVLTPTWRNRFLAAATYQLRRHETEPTRSLAQRIEKALSS